VVIDSPRGRNGYYGGQVSAPVFQRIAAGALRHHGVPPTIDAPPPLLVARREGAVPERPAAAPARRAIVPVVSAVQADGAVFPDLRGLSARDALRALGRLGVNARLDGDGVVVRQQPEPGAPMERGASGTLWLERQIPRP
jgi:cell division protein FtsI (penicillin-binding protein 3)